MHLHWKKVAKYLRCWLLVGVPICWIIKPSDSQRLHSWSTPNTAFLPNQRHFIQLVSSLVETTRSEMGVSDKGDMLNVQCWGGSRNMAGNHWSSQSWDRICELHRIVKMYISKLNSELCWIVNDCCLLFNFKLTSVKCWKRLKQGCRQWRERWNLLPHRGARRPRDSSQNSL